MDECENGEIRVLPDGRTEKCIAGMWIPLPSAAPGHGGGVSAQTIVQATTEDLDTVKEAIASPNNRVTVIIEET
jgi:hypothetical protein